VAKKTLLIALLMMSALAAPLAWAQEEEDSEDAQMQMGDEDSGIEEFADEDSDNDASEADEADGDVPEELEEEEESDEASTEDGEAGEQAQVFAEESDTSAEEPAVMATATPAAAPVKPAPVSVSTPDTPPPSAGCNAGTVKFFNEEKGIGFIVDIRTGGDIFVKSSGLIDNVREGDVVCFDIERGPKGLMAVKVRRA